MKKQVALYGNANLERVYCRGCAGWALVVDGFKLCCDRPSLETATTVKRMSSSAVVR